MEEIQIAITGAGGFVGTSLRRYLSSNGLRLISLTRKKLAPVQFEKNIVFSDLGLKGIANRARGCDALVHLIGSGAQTVDADYHSVNVLNAEKAVLLCKRAGIKKIVYISGLGVRPDTTSGYFISKLKAERLISRSGLDYTILRASYIVGKGDPLSKNLARQARSGTILIPGSGSYRLQPISVDDVCKVILHSVTDANLSNKTVDLVGPKTVTFAEYARRFAKSKKAATKKIDLQEAYHDALNRPSSAVYGLDDLNILVGDFTSSHKRLEKLCGFQMMAPTGSS